MRIKIDEDLPNAAAQLLRQRRYEANTVMGQGKTRIYGKLFNAKAGS